MREQLQRPVARLGRNVIETIWRAGSMARFFGLVLASSGTSFQRFRLVMREVYFSGVLSLVIIVVSGLFVGILDNATVGIAAPEEKSLQMAIQLARWGVTRVCPLGQMQNPPLTWRHDGRPALGDLITWTGWEQ